MSSSEPLDKDSIFEVLSSSRRRQLLYHLYQRGGTAQLRDLARDTAVAEQPDDLDDDDIKRYYISLYQTHVPKLEQFGLIKYDQDRQEVELTDRITEITRVLGDDTNTERPWEWYYAGLAIIGLTIAPLPFLGIAAFSLFETPFVAIGLSLGLLVLTLFHHRDRRETGPDPAGLEALVSP